MVQVYEVVDDDVVEVDGAEVKRMEEEKGLMRETSLGNNESEEGSANGRVEEKSEDEEMHGVEMVVIPATSSSPQSSSVGDIKMEDDVALAVERNDEDGRHNGMKTDLPNQDDSSLLPPTTLHNSTQLPTTTTNASTSAKPPSSKGGLGAASADEKSRKPSSSVKPKSTKRRSPSPEPLPPPPQLKTIRLEIFLGGPENYEVDITQLSKDTGQRPPTPPPPPKLDPDTSESEDEPAVRKGAGVGKGKGKAGRKSATVEYYDLNDPFIDDSELAMDQRTYIGQTKQQGFYVSSGEVALLKDKSHDRDSREPPLTTLSPAKKPKSKKNVVPTIIPLAGSHAVNAAVASSASISTGPSTSTAVATASKASPTDPFGPPLAPARQGSRDSPITLSDTEEGKSTISAPLPKSESVSTNGHGQPPVNAISSDGGSLKRKGSETSTSRQKKRKTIEIESFHQELQPVLHELKAAIARESFDQKGKFPPSLKPLLARVALKAIQVGQYNDMFFQLMPKLFIYNKFTMSKLIKRTVYADHQKLLMVTQDELIKELSMLAQEGFETAKSEYEKSVAAWERRQEKSKAGAASAEGTPAPGSSTPSVNGAQLPLPVIDTGADSGMEVDGAPPATPAQGADKDKDGGNASVGPGHSSQHMPTQRFRLTERMRHIIWELVALSNESCKIENEKNHLENSTVQISEQGTRKVLYQKIVAAFPEGWMSSGQVSREVSVMKKRFEAQQDAEKAERAERERAS